MTPPQHTSIKKSLGLAPGSIVYVGNKHASDLDLQLFEYDANFYEEKDINTIEEVFPYIDATPITWINVNGLNHTKTIERLGAHCHLHSLILEDIANTHQRPKIEDYENYLFVVLKMLYFNENQELCIEHMSLVLGDTYVLSFQESNGDVFDTVRNRIRHHEGRIRTKGADYLLYALMDAIVDNYFNLIEAVGDKIEEMEDMLFEEQSNELLAQDIQLLKKEILMIRRAVFPLREVINKLEKSEHKVIDEKTQLYVRDLYDHIIQVTENVEIYREMTWSLMEMYMTTISNKMNEVMKVLTIIATIFIPLTFLAGIYGMNFENIPELKFKYGYYVFWAILVAIFISLMLYFKRKKWL